MKTLYGALILTVFSWFQITAFVIAADINGLWTKTTNADPNNITIFFREKETVRAIGFSTSQGKKTVWHATGQIKEPRMQLSYHYSVDAILPGWEADGIMELSISDDGNIISGVAISISGNWSGKIEFKRVQIVSPKIE